MNNSLWASKVHKKTMKNKLLKFNYVYICSNEVFTSNKDCNSRKFVVANLQKMLISFLEPGITLEKWKMKLGG